MSISVWSARGRGGEVGLLHRIAVLANEASTLSEAVPAALDEVCSFARWPVGHAYFIDPTDQTVLNSTSLWHLPERGFGRFKEVTESTPLLVGVGLPGRVLRSGRGEWCENALTDDNFPRAHTDREIEVRGGFAIPVLCGREVVAVLEFFSDRPQERDTALLDLVGQVGTQLGRVAERERAAAKLVDQLEYTNHLIESASDAFVAVDRDGTITDWNAAAEKMFGWTRAEVTGRPLSETIVPERYREGHLEGVRRYIASGEARVLERPLELPALHREGYEFPIELVVWPVGTTERFRFCAFIRDITERREMLADLLAADEESRLGEQRLVAAQELAGVGSWEWDIETNVVTWSRQLHRNFQTDPETFQPSYRGYLDLVHPQDRDFVDALVQIALATREPFEFEHRVVTPTGEERIHSCAGRVIVADGRPVGMAGTDRDVTEERRAATAVQEALQREREMVAKLKELDETKTRFVSSVSHELRTPLTSILGYTQFLTDSADELKDEHREMLGIIDRNSHRLLALIEDLLTQSRIESGTFKLALRPTDLAPIVESVFQAMQPNAVERRLELKACRAPDVGLVLGDAEQLERLLLNLVSNALKFTTSGGVHVRTHQQDGEVVLEVSDTGIGIPADETDGLFTPFFRTSNADHTTPGTGLGLVIVKAIVQEHNGTIAVESREGSGTTFTVRLPASA